MAFGVVRVPLLAVENVAAWRLHVSEIGTEVFKDVGFSLNAGCCPFPCGLAGGGPHPLQPAVGPWRLKGIHVAM